MNQGRPVGPWPRTVFNFQIQQTNLASGVIYQNYIILHAGSNLCVKWIADRIYPLVCSHRKVWNLRYLFNDLLDRNWLIFISSPILEHGIMRIVYFQPMNSGGTFSNSDPIQSHFIWHGNLYCWWIHFSFSHWRNRLFDFTWTHLWFPTRFLKVSIENYSSRIKAEKMGAYMPFLIFSVIAFMGVLGTIFLPGMHHQASHISISVFYAPYYMCHILWRIMWYGSCHGKISLRYL